MLKNAVQRGTVVILCMLYFSSFAYGQSEPSVLFLPLIFRDGQQISLPDPTAFQLAFVNDAGAWLVNADGSGKTQLTTTIFPAGLIANAPAGDKIAIELSNGWSIFDGQGTVLAQALGAGHSLRWHPDNQTLLLAQLNRGISRYILTTSQTDPLITTTDATNDHSPFWNASGEKLIFAHQEFGTKLYVTLVDPYDGGQLPYIGENHAGNKLNPKFTLLLATESWHDQPIFFHWANNEQKIIFGARNTIHVLDLATATSLKIEPAGYGVNENARMVDVTNDQIVYVRADGLYRVDTTGQNGRLLVVGKNFQHPQRTPAGDGVVFGNVDGLSLVDLNGQAPTLIPNTAGAQHFVVFKRSAANQK